MSKVNSPIEAAFFRSLAEGDVAQIKSMVSDDPALLKSHNYRNFGATPLTSVCFANRPELVDLLIDLGADPNQKSDWEMGPWSPLHCAIYRHDTRLANQLLSRGAQMDVHTAAGIGNCEVLEELLVSDSSRVHERGGDGCYPLHFADSVAVAELLLAYGAVIDGRCIDHYSTAVQYLCKDRPDVAKYLLSKGAMADVFSTVVCGDVSRLKQMLVDDPSLLEARINQTFFPPSEKFNVHNILTFVVGQDTTPLHAAANCNSATAVPVLVEMGARTDARGGYDMATPLHLAAWNDSVEAATALVDCGADMNAKSGKLHNNSPAGWAIVAGSDRVLEMLLSRGAEIFPWFIDDANDGCNGRFDQIRYVDKEVRHRIRLRLLK